MKRYLIVGAIVLAIAGVYIVVQLARVPAATGTYLDARGLLEDAGFEVATTDSSGASIEPHDLALIVSQDPAAGTLRMFGSTVTLETRPPRERVVVPDVVGTRVSEAANVVHDAGLMLNTGGWIADDGIIASTIPAAGESIRFGATVTYILADAP